MLKKILVGIFILIIVGVCAGAYLWNKPHKTVDDEKGIGIAATSLAKEYKADEKAADAKYLNKVIEVTGTINEIDKNQDGGTMIVLQTDDPMAGVQCGMREKNLNPVKGQNAVIKGFCSGNGITGITLTDCVIEQSK